MVQQRANPARQQTIALSKTTGQSGGELTRREMLGRALVSTAAVGATVVGQGAGRAEAASPTATAVAAAQAQSDRPPLTPAISAYIAGIQTAKIPAEHLDLGKRHILDTLASVVACRDLEPSVLARNYSLSKTGGDGPKSATILGTKDRAALVDAAFASAMTAHGAEINDFIPSAFVQPGPAVVSVAMVLAESRGGTGEQILRASIAGYELCGRIPKALGNRKLYSTGLANHGIGPTFGAAATAASMIGLSEDRVPHVLTYAVQQASGSWQWLLDVEHIEKSFVFAGMGARNGLEAALLVEAGFRGVRDSLDHPDGWMEQECFAGGDHNPAYLVEELGTRSELPSTAFKRYPVGGPTQPAVKGLLELLPEIDRSALDTVRIEMPGRWQAFRDAEMPALNLRYLSSIILIDGELDFFSAQSRERFKNDAEVRRLMERITIAHDPDQEAAPGEPRKESARVIVTETNGKVHTIFVPYVTGFPSHPMTRDEVEAKALELMTPRLGAERAREVVRVVGALETLDSGADLVQLIAT